MIAQEAAADRGTFSFRPDEISSSQTIVLEFARIEAVDSGDDQRIAVVVQVADEPVETCKTR